MIVDTTRQISVVLIEDHPLVRRGVKDLLSRDRDICVVGEAESSNQATIMITQTQPDVAIVDIRLRQGSGIDVSKAIKSLSPKTEILVLTAYDDIQYVSSLMKIGISGYLLKTTSPKELRKAVHDVAENRVAFSPAIIEKMMSLLAHGKKDSSPKFDEVNLTPRQADVLTHMGEGSGNREIADALGVSRKTVEAHVVQIFRKLGVQNRTQAIFHSRK